ncbi:MAG: hypothetical protein U0263_19145 [Polyangiaceae bacterium]
MTMRALVVSVALGMGSLVGIGCGGSGSAGGTSGAGGSAATGGSSATGGTSAGGASGTGGAATGGTSASGGSSGIGGSGGSGGSASYCPTANLGSTLPITYDGTTVGKPNIVTSSRLEWTDAGDDALLFTAPAAGTYHIAMPQGPGGCGASIREYGPQRNGMGEIYTPNWCPAPGSSVEIDGVFAAIPPSTTQDVALTSGQQVLIWVSCAYWSKPTEGAYQLVIDQAGP